MKDDDKDKDDARDRRLDDLVARAFVRRGEIAPTTEAEVLAAEEDGVELEGDLPPELTRFGDKKPEAPMGAASQRVVSLNDARRAKQRSGGAWATHAATFALGAAAAAALLIGVRASQSPTAGQDPAGGPSAAGTASAPPAPERVQIPAVSRCAEDCCAGSSCGAAKGELRACGTGRTCVPCGDLAGPGSAYRVRIGNLLPTKLVDPAALPAYDICARISGSPWSCEPAYADAAARPEGRTLPFTATADDLAAGMELELRERGRKQAVGRWRDAVRVGPTVLCRGVGVLVATEKEEHLGSLSLFLEDAHFVEMARDADVGPLQDRRARLAFADVVPSIVETRSPGAERFALMAGPFDGATAERLRWALVERGQSARVVLGGDYEGKPRRLP